MERASRDVRFQWRTPAKGHGVTASRMPRLKPESCEVKDSSSVLLVTPGAFREFARLDTGGDRMLLGEVIDFANLYGDILALPDQEHPTGETWCNAIQEMRQAVSLWDRINDRNASNEARRRAQRSLQLKIHRALTDTETPRHTTIGLTPELGIALYPVNLLAYLWLTFSRVVSGEIEERRCLGKSKGCLGYIYIGSGPGLQRNDVITCSDACRQHKKRREAIHAPVRPVSASR